MWNQKQIVRRDLAVRDIGDPFQKIAGGGAPAGFQPAHRYFRRSEERGQRSLGQVVLFTVTAQRMIHDRYCYHCGN